MQTPFCVGISYLPHALPCVSKKKKKKKEREREGRSWGEGREYTISPCTRSMIWGCNAPPDWSVRLVGGGGGGDGDTAVGCCRAVISLARGLTVGKNIARDKFTSLF